MSAHSDVNMLGHRREPPYGQSMTEQVDVVNGLNGPSARASPNVRRQHGSPQRGDNGRSQYDVAEVMVLWEVVSARDVGPGFVIPNRPVKEVQTDAVSSVLTTLLGIEVIERAPIVLVDISVLHKHALGNVRNLRLETMGNSTRIELWVQHLHQAVVASRVFEIDPIVRCQCTSSLVGCFLRERDVT